jgi:hypothetical protein
VPHRLATRFPSHSRREKLIKGISIVSQLFDASDDGTCDAYRACRDHLDKVDTRTFLEDAWPRVRHFVGDREGHFLTEFRSNFLAKSRERSTATNTLLWPPWG